SSSRGFLRRTALLFCCACCPTLQFLADKHFAYLLEILSSFAFRHAEAFRTFAGSALQRCVFLRKSAFHLCWQCSPSSHFATQLLQTCWKCFYHRIIRRKTASHFCWKCFVSSHCPTRNRPALLLEMLSSGAFYYGGAL